MHSFRLKALLFFVLLYTEANAQSSSKPNIIFILGDDIGFTIPSVYGGKSFSTPNLDSMAHYGKSFTHCEAAPLCSPSRFMLLTGKYNFRNYSNWGYMNFSEKTFGNLMHDAGYSTGFFGKIQLQITDSAIHAWGFDKYTVFELMEDTMQYRRYKNPVLFDNGYRIPDSITANKYCDDILTQKLFDFIDSNSKRPFFAYYPMSLAHAPFSPTPDDSAFAGWNPDINNSDSSFFPSMIKYMDKKIGQILDKINSSNTGRNTIVIFAGDNGTPSGISFNDGNSETQGEKGTSAEGGTHVPLIAYWPNHIKAGSVNDDLIDFTDFFPTFAQAARVTDLSNYGLLDGVSFYNRMLGMRDTLKQQLFMHFSAHPETDNDTLERWVRNKTYKLYDSTASSRAGKFYNIAIDSEQIHPIADSELTRKEIAVKQKFRHILDTIGNWAQAPVINSPSIGNIQSTSVVLSATIISQGASTLIERGSCLSPSKSEPYLQFNRLKDSSVNLGMFSQKRINLKSERRYLFSLYAMNGNVSHSTSYVMSNFYTLSNAPRHQATSFTSSSDNCKIHLAWSGAKFPNTGASQGGYMIIYSADAPALITEPNGHSPEQIIANGKIASLYSSILPALPVDSAEIDGLSPDSMYQFMLIPYTWNGLSDSTYNYLTQRALTLTQSLNNCPNNRQTFHNKHSVIIEPNPSSSTFNLHINAYHSALLVAINVFNTNGAMVYKAEGSNNASYTFGKSFAKGFYVVKLIFKDHTETFKLIKL